MVLFGKGNTFVKKGGMISLTTDGIYYIIVI